MVSGNDNFIFAVNGIGKGDSREHPPSQEKQRFSLLEFRSQL
jgi:hypothetical protein